MKLFRFGLLLSLMLFLLPWRSAAAQASLPQVQEISVQYGFGQEIIFYGQVTPAQAVSQALLFFRPQGETNTRVAVLSLQSDGRFEYHYPVSQAPIRAFSQVSFWFNLNQNNGESLTSSEYFFTYLDNRFPWQTIHSGQITLHWYAGDAAFGQDLADSAARAQQNIANLLGNFPAAEYHIYVYAAAADLQTALERGGQAWVAGHADPDLGVGLVSIAPGPEQGLQMDRQLAHELMHLAHYRSLPSGYASLPVWLKEGLAANAELIANPDYEVAISAAAQKNNLLPFTSLCASFPSDAASRFLAYAQSDSFVRRLKEQYGVSGIQALNRAYADGLGCEEGVQRALGISLTQAEQAWRTSTLGQNILLEALKNISAYALLLLLFLVPVGLRRWLP